MKVRTRGVDDERVCLNEIQQEGSEMNRLGKKLVAGAVGALFVSVGLTLAAAPAQAAQPSGPMVKAATCAQTSTYHVSYDWNQWVWMPAYYQNQSCTLQTGVANEAVWALQLTLLECYGKNIAVDNDFGPATRNALIQVQAAAGIAADGIYGNQTRSIMKWRGSSGCVHNQYVTSTYFPLP